RGVAMDLGIETIYQCNSMVPTMSIARNLFIGREPTRFSVLGVGILDQKKMAEESIRAIANVDLHLRSPDALVGELSGGQRQGVAVARAAAFGSKVVIMDEPTAALGVKESRRVLELILDVKKRGLPIVLISHNMPHVFEVADRIHIHRLGRRLCVVDPKQISMSDAVALMTGAKKPPEDALAA
ncbi:MAG: sugar ABC transporter ATP-binding protein, partial [Mesorhizobium sp.]